MMRTSSTFIVEDVLLVRRGLLVVVDVPSHLWEPGKLEAFIGPMELTKPDGEQLSVVVDAVDLFTHCFSKERPGGFLLAGELTPTDVPLKSMLRKA